MAAENFRFELEKEAVVKDKRYPKKTDFSSSLIGVWTLSCISNSEKEYLYVKFILNASVWFKNCK